MAADGTGDQPGTGARVATMLTDHDEQVLVRRVVTILCGLALLTVPLVHLVLGGTESWVAVAHLLVFGGGFAALGRTRLSTGQVVIGAALVLWAATVASVGMTAHALVTGAGRGVGLGTGLLWLAAGLGPAMFLVLDVRRGLVAALGALAGAVGVLAVATRGRLRQVVAHEGVWQVLVATLVVLCAAAAVAWLAGRSAEGRSRALLLRQEQAARTARLEVAQQRREALFSRTATELQVPVRQLTVAAGELPGTAAGEQHADGVLERIERLADELLQQVVDDIGQLVDRIRHEGTPDPTTVADGAAPHDDEADAATTVLMSFGVFAMVALDAWRVVVLAAGGVPDAHAAAAAANRMVVVLFLAAAVITVRFPGRFGWSLSALALLAHPVVVLLVVDPAPREVLLVPFAASWRIAVLAAGMLAVLATIIERRVEDRDALVAAASDEEARSTELQRREEAAELAYAEAAHELKNPLSVIGGAARTLRQHGALLAAPQADQLRAAMTSAVQRLDARLEVMREVAGEDTSPVGGHTASGPARSARPLAAADVLLDALAAARMALDDQPVDVDVRVTGDWTAAAPHAVEHVVENLLSNAHKYGESDELVRFSARRADGEIVVEVANRGGSLSSADAERVFEPYWRAADADEHADGTGIGLALVARLVEQWRGRCWAEVAGGWTRVVFTMPVTETTRAPTWQHLQDQLG